MIGEVIGNGVNGIIFASNALAAEEDVLGMKIAGEIRFGHDPRRHVPVERPGASIRLLDAVAVSIVSVGVTRGTGDTVLLVEVVIQTAGGVVGHVAGCVVRVAAL